MAFLGDYHIHSINSKHKAYPKPHAKGTIEENAKQAAELGLKEIAIADHGFNHKLFCTYRKKLPILKEQCKQASEKYKINVLLGVEANIISSDGKIDVAPDDLQYLDIVLCGFHNIVRAASVKDKFTMFYFNILAKMFGLSKTRIKINTEAFIKAIEKNNIDIITHLNYGICKVDAIKVAEAALKKGTLIELNNKKRHFKKEEIEAMISMGVKFIANSDAHSIERIADFKKSRDIIKEYNIPKENLVNWDNLPDFINYKRK